MNDAVIITGTTEIEKSTAHFVVGIIEYMPDAVACTTIIKKLTGDISVFSFDKGAGLPVQTSPFDTYILIMEGTAELLVDRKSNMMAAGKGIIIPAHTSLLIVQAAERFKMMRTVIKSGYES